MSNLSVASAAPVRVSRLDLWLRARVTARLSNLRGGRIRLHDAFGTLELGDEGPAVELHVRSLRFYRAVAAGGSVGAAEAYRDGLWTCGDLVGLIRLLVRNRALLDSMENGTARLSGWAMRMVHARRANTRTGARRNIAAHYDLGNAFFALFLSDDLMYSAAMFEQADDTLQTASARKLDVICAKLQLRPGQRLLDIGGGWGGLALHAALRYDCEVTMTTLSQEQWNVAQARVHAAGMQDRITVLCQDFRDLKGTYDKVVSIEMVEAIGARNLPAFFGCITQRLAPEGLALIQAITIEDHRYDHALHSVDFIKRHIFPGSFIPSIAALIEAKARSSDLALIHLADFGLSYARTLHEWRTRFLQRVGEVREQGYDEDFIRLWEFYLAYCEGGFRERAIGVAQLLLARPGYRVTDADAVTDHVEA